MKNTVFKTMLSLIIAAAMLLALLPGGAFDVSAADGGECGDGVNWTFDSSTGALTITGAGKMYDYSLSEPAPWQLKGVTGVSVKSGVTGIGKYAFANCGSMNSVEIADSVKSIGSKAFYNSGYYNDMSKWKNGVLYIGKWLIQAKTGIYGAYEVKSGTVGIADFAFDACASVTGVAMPVSLKVIGGYAFNACEGLTSVSFPNGGVSIGEYAFLNCSALNAITIPDSVTYIGRDAFTNTPFVKNASNWSEKMLYIGKWLVEASVSISGDCAVADGTVGIAARAFASCWKLNTLTVPASVKSIGEQAFFGCNALTLSVYENSQAHKYAVANNVRYQLIGGCSASRGDMDKDGEITVADALVALRIAAKLAAETPELLEIGDIDGDGHVTVADALSILRVAAKLASADSL